MTQRERFIKCALRQPIDRAPLIIGFGPWPETAERWAKENGAGSDAWFEGLDYDNRVVGVFGIDSMLKAFYWPNYEQEIFSRENGKITFRDYLGNICEACEGKSGIPNVIKSPVETLEDWEKIKRERLNPHDPERFPENWADIVKALNEGDAPVQIGAFPWGLFGSLRDLMGTKECLIAFYDSPELVHRIMADLTDFWLVLYEKACKDLKVDMVHIWEDMSGKAGSLLSPAMIEEFMLPHYRRIRKFADEHDIPVFSVDTDGDCEELIPVFASAGVNMMFPFEVTAGCDVVALHEKYPYMSMQGGIDKEVIAKGKPAIDTELARIEPLLSKTGYFPSLDHCIPPEIGFDDYCYYVKKLRELIFKHAR